MSLHLQRIKPFADRAELVFSPQTLLLAKKIDKAVFPGEQGGPHVHVFAALATTFKIAASEPFQKLQQSNYSIIAWLLPISCRNVACEFHLEEPILTLEMLIVKQLLDLMELTLSGDMAARILDIAGIVLNRNTIPGDKTALFSSGIRYGTPWMTQRGIG